MSLAYVTSETGQRGLSVPLAHESIQVDLSRVQLQSPEAVPQLLAENVVGFRLPDVLVGTGLTAEGDPTSGPDQVFIGSYDTTGKAFTWLENTIDLDFNWGDVLPSPASTSDATYAVLASAWASYTQSALNGIDGFDWVISCSGRFLLFTPAPGNDALDLLSGNTGLPVVHAGNPSLLSKLEFPALTIAL